MKNNKEKNSDQSVKETASLAKAKATIMSRDLSTEKENQSKANQIKVNQVKINQKLPEKKINLTEKVLKKGTAKKPLFLPLARKNKKRRGSIIIIALTILLLAGAGTGLYLFRDKIFEKESPQEIINSSMKAMANAQSYAFTGNFDFDFSSLNNEQSQEDKVSVLVNFDGKNDKNDPANIKRSFNIKPEGILVQESGSEEISFDFSTMSFGKIGEENVYFKLNDFNLGTISLIYGEVIAPYENNWYFLNMTKMKKELSVYPKENSFGFEEKKEEIKKISKKYEIIKFQKDLGDMKINGKTVYHYQIGIDAETLLDFNIEMMQETFAIPADEINKTISENAKKETVVYLNKILDNVEIEIWIGKEDRFIYQIDLKSDFNEEDIKEIIDLTIGQARAKAMDAQIKSEIASKRIDLIIYCDDHNDNCEGYENRDKSTGWGASASSEYQPEKHTKTSGNSYVVWSELCSTTDKWCVDSTDKQGYTLEEIIETQCPDNLSAIPQGEKKNCTTDNIPTDIPVIKISSNLTMKIFDFNQPSGLVQPENTVDLSETLEKAMGELSGKIITPVEHPDSDNDGLSDIMEDVYKTDKSNPDTDGDGYLDGGEVERGYDPLIPGDARLDNLDINDLDANNPKIINWSDNL